MDFSCFLGYVNECEIPNNITIFVELAVGGGLAVLFFWLQHRSNKKINQLWFERQRRVYDQIFKKLQWLSNYFEKLNRTLNNKYSVPYYDPSKKQQQILSHIREDDTTLSAWVASMFDNKYYTAQSVEILPLLLDEIKNEFDDLQRFLQQNNDVVEQNLIDQIYLIVDDFLFVIENETMKPPYDKYGDFIKRFEEYKKKINDGPLKNIYDEFLRKNPVSGSWFRSTKVSTYVKQDSDQK